MRSFHHRGVGRAPWLIALIALMGIAACDGVAVVGGSLPQDGGGQPDVTNDLANDAADAAGDVKVPPADGSAADAAADVAGDVPGDAMMARCMSNADCVGNPIGPACNVMTGMCIPACRSAADCAGSPAGAICDAMSGLCTMRCSGHGDCAASMAGNICNPMTNMCAMRCASNTDCVAHPGGTVCNPMSGACVPPCRANSDCAMSAAGPVCNAMTGLCGNSCRAATDCAGTPTTICSAMTMTCVARCATNADCMGSTDGAVCSPMTGRCVQPCRTNTDCTSNPAGEICDPTSMLCGTRCRSHMDCAGMMGTICNPMSNLCVSRCAANADCMGHPGGAVCDTAAGRCVECVASTDTCSPDQHCDPMSNACVAGCRADEGCPRVALDDGGMGAQLRCNVMTRTCEACVTDTHCPTGQRCSAGSCVAGCTDDSRCAMGERCCGGACVNPVSNAQNCGACGTRCMTSNGDPGCESSACIIARCTAPFGNCDMNTANGCETNNNTSLTHCGSCGNPCPMPANARPTCTEGACGFTCNSGFADCNSDPADGCETNTETSVGNCGACGRSCSAANGTAGCAMGACAVASCNAGFANCDMNAANGCEVSTNTTVGNCGRCGNVCPNPANGTAACTAGACGIAACAPGFADCNMMAADGCEVNLNSSASSCGACGRGCTVANGTAACMTGVCAVGACNAGFADCDGAAATGCETNLANTVGSCGRCGNACSIANGVAGCAMGACTVAMCNTGFANCDLSAANGCEVNTRTDASNCSACGNVCRIPGGTNVCAAGVCLVSACGAGLGDCDGNMANGCETTLAASLMHCGACRNACVTANGTPSCLAGACGVATCNAGFGNCDMNAANGCETSTATAVAHCGGCGRACATRPNTVVSCAASTCAYICAAGFADCDGNAMNGCETNLTTDVANCGMCRRACPPATGGSATCAAGVCGQACPAGQTNCSGVCRATLTDVSNCGACARVCSFANASATCASGTCALGGCATGFGNCDGNAANGCETNTTNALANCGSCGRVCPVPTGGSATCSNGTCGQSCPAGTTNCSGVCRNLQTDAASCGACGRACSATQACVNGTCIGSGSLRVTMTWDVNGDMDLHVQGPAPCAEIYYGARSSCGGTLDVDNTTQRGPENVNWPTTYPAGTYYVCPEAYTSAVANANYTVTVVRRGVTILTRTGRRGRTDGNVRCTSGFSGVISFVP